MSTYETDGSEEVRRQTGLVSFIDRFDFSLPLVSATAFGVFLQHTPRLGTWKRKETQVRSGSTTECVTMYHDLQSEPQGSVTSAACLCIRHDESPPSVHKTVTVASEIYHQCIVLQAKGKMCKSRRPWDFSSQHPRHPVPLLVLMSTTMARCTSRLAYSKPALVHESLKHAAG